MVQLTEQERTAFYQEITRNRALDYFYVFDNVPLHFIYRDKLDRGELTKLERRNKEITETVWLDAYHQYLVSNVGYQFLYRGPILQMVWQIPQIGAGTFAPPPQEEREVRETATAVQASFDSWMSKSGWQLAEELRARPRASWLSLLSVPDRTVRIASLIPTGNEVLLELVTTWTEQGVLNETAWVVVLVYDADGTVLQDRSYIDLNNWPSSRQHNRQARVDRKEKIDSANVIDQFFDYHRSRRLRADHSNLERRNLHRIESAWLAAYNGDANMDIYHPERFRLQLPVQKCSCNFAIAEDIEHATRQLGCKMRLGMTYAKGNQVVAEGVVSWNANGKSEAVPFISFFLLDQDGLIIRERRYLTLEYWPVASAISGAFGG